ncbi:MAG: lipocalin family protein [Betaproteobacteria bacterium]|nr:lipocalin family protein [Betaproteobacteria bacterium]
MKSLEISRTLRYILTTLIGTAMALLSLTATANPAGVIGDWRMVSHVSTFEGQKFDSHAALLQQRPCAAQIVYKINADGTFRLDASGSTCDDKYKKTQEKLYAKTKWKLEGDKFTTSATNFAVGQTYTVTVAGNKMTLVGTDGQGTLVYQKK